MRSFIHIPPFHRILMDIVQLLPEYLFVFNKLRMRSFFPALIIPVLTFVIPAKKRQLLQQSLGATFFQVADQFASCVGFEAAIP
jgi:hypothetical protein